MTGKPEDGSLEAFVTHLQDQQKAAAAHAEKIADEASERMAILTERKRAKIEIENFHETYVGTKYKWLRSVEEFRKTKLRTCPHIDLIRPEIMFNAIFEPKTLGCSECIHKLLEEFNKNNPNNCDFCFQENEIFYETMFQIGYCIIFGNLCATCHKKQNPLYV